VALAQALYFGITGLWPLVHMPSFLRITGPKADLWLVRCVGWLVTVVALVLFHSWRRDHVSEETALLGIGSALALGGVSTWYALKGRIWKTYLADTVVEIALIVCWIITLPSAP
jgi:hypothetical protein